MRARWLLLLFLALGPGCCQSALQIVIMDIGGHYYLYRGEKRLLADVVFLKKMKKIC